MSPSLDLWVLQSVGWGLAVFLPGHVLALRWIEPKKFSKAFIASAALGGAFCWAYWFWRGPIQGAPWTAILPAAAAASLIYAFLTLHFGSFIFGVGETAIRMRLLFELHRRPGRRGTLEQILQNYNARVFLGLRLERLVGGGRVRLDGGVYRLGALGPIKVQILAMKIIGRLLGKADVW